jgi:uncharacterized membrane protein
VGAALALAVASAISIGAADFFAGVLGKRDPTNSALAVTYVVVLVTALPVALVATGLPTTEGFGWGAAMGVSWAIGLFALARGMALGRVIVVVPIAGVLSAGIPVAVDLLSGTQPGRVVIAGVVVGIIAVALTGIGSEDHPGRSVAWSATQGAIGGVATGVSLILMDQAADSGLWPLVTASFVAAAAMVVVALATKRRVLPPRLAVPPAVAMGVLIAVAFVAALSALTRGSLTVVAVIVSQYPVVTILLVALLWQQRPRGVQYLGVALALVAVGLIAAG